jgi:hypothetical protein
MSARALVSAAIGAAALSFVSCGASEPPAPKQAAEEGPRPRGFAADDRSRCDYLGRVDREASETAGPGSAYPNIRRVFATFGEGETRRRVLVCREVDTNLDGRKDLVRTYDDQGEPVSELADTNHDGTIDTWVKFVAGRIARVDIDTNGDGRPDETRYYTKGRLSRVQRDTNQDGRVDVWEIYTEGRLQRMGVDLDHDGHVDRWDRDEILARELAEREREAEQPAADAGAPEAGALRGGG